MNLIQYTNRNFIISAIIALPIVCVGLFFSIKYFVTEETDEKLFMDQLRAIEVIKNSDEVPNLVPLIEVEITDANIESPNVFQEVYVYDPIEKEEELFRELSTVKKINGHFYSINVRSSMLETHDFLIAVLVVVIALMVSLILISFFLNRRMSQKLWNSFHQNLQTLSKFSVVDQKEIVLVDSNIAEFKKLNTTLKELTNQINADYRALKEFTENASHELQTPLAVIMNTAEQVMQDVKDEESSEGLYKIYQYAKKLSQLNKKLLLLAKIENRQFNAIQKVDINPIVHDKIEVFKELNEHLNIHVEFVSDESFYMQMDKELAELLISNLVSNAFKHNLPNGNIQIQLSNKQFSIGNSTDQNIDEVKVFERFVHGGNKNSMGIGLAIVQTITRISGLKIDLKAEKNFFSINLSEIQN